MSFINPYRFAGDSGFRYLHDEISGGLFGYSHLQTKSSYTDFGLSITGASGIDYNYIDGLIPLSTIQSDFPTSQSVSWYDQINANDITPTGSGGGWNGTDFASQTLRNTTLSGYSLTLSDPHTTIVVVNMTATGAGTTQGILDIYNNSNLYYTMVYAGSNDLLLRKRNSANSTRSFSGVRNTGTHILIWTDSGSLNSTGTQLYYDDMATAVTPSSTSGTITDNTINTALAVKQCLGGNSAQITGYVLEFHQFNKVLSQSERETAKEILEQYYTFS